MERESGVGRAADHLGLIAIGVFAAMLYAVFEVVTVVQGLSVYFNTISILSISVFSQMLINRSKDAETQLARINRSLEDQVAYRTAQLQLSYEDLLSENAIRRQTEQKLKDSETRYRTMFENTGMATIIVEADGAIILANREFCRLSGYSLDDLAGRKTLMHFLSEEDEARIRRLELPRAANTEAAPPHMEAQLQGRDGTRVQVLLTTARIPESSRTLVSFSDVSELKKAQETIKFQAFYDLQTGLPNKALFLDHLKMAMVRHKSRTGYRYAVVAVNIDRFKLTVDSLGHGVELQLLELFSGILRDATRPVDTVARIGTGEFAILLDDVGEPGGPVWLVQKIQKRLQAPFRLGSEEVFVSASFGLVTNCEDYHQAEHVLRDADMAMLSAKEAGKGRFAVYDRTMHEQAVRLLQMENDLRRALDKKELKVHYQPIVACDTRRLVGFEALARWEHPEWGLIHPDAFIPVAEDSGLIVEIGHWVLHEACLQLRRIHQSQPGADGLFMSVNLSGRQLGHPEIEDQTRRVLNDSGLDPHRLKLEITESVVMSDPEAVIDLLGRFKRMGVRLGIDDFGTGYSSLSYLQKFPVDTLKVDRSFVSRMDPHHPENQKIVEIIITLAHSLGLGVIAEGVETSEQQSILSFLRCQFAQGFLFSHPMDRPAMEALVSSPGPIFC
jgi:Amt family ammonium transporter